MAYAVVCFDVGYTLIHEHRRTDELLTAVLAELGHTADAQALAAARELAQRWYNSRYHTLDNDDWSSDATIRRLWLTYYEHLFSALDPALDHHLLADRLIAHYETPDLWAVYPDVWPTLRALRERGTRIGVVSDWSGRLRPILHATGLSRWIDFVVGSADAGYAKPMSDLYALAVSHAGVAAQQIIHVGDNYLADVLGARSVGIDAALIDRDHRHPPVDCPLLHDLRDVLMLHPRVD